MSIKRDREDCVGGDDASWSERLLLYIEFVEAFDRWKEADEAEDLRAVYLRWRELMEARQRLEGEKG